jgi:hypothetical protein
MRAKDRCLCCVLILGLAVGGVTGPGGRALADADPKLTMDLVKLVTPPENYQAIIQQMTRQLVASMQQSGVPLPPDVDSKMAQAVMEALPYDDLTSWNVEVYAPRFTTDEIRQLIAFYNTQPARRQRRCSRKYPARSARKWGRSSLSACRRR